MASDPPPVTKKLKYSTSWNAESVVVIQFASTGTAQTSLTPGRRLCDVLAESWRRHRPQERLLRPTYTNQTLGSGWLYAPTVRCSPLRRSPLAAMTVEPTLIVLSGAVCAGKSTLARGLAADGAGVTLTTRALIARELGAEPARVERGRLQEEGDRLDAESGGKWIAAAAAELLDSAATGLVVVDAVRKEPQLEALAALSPLLHVHLSASETDLGRRYRARQRAAPRAGVSEPRRASRQHHRGDGRAARRQGRPSDQHQRRQCRTGASGGAGAGGGR